MPGHGGHGSMPHRPADGTRNVPSRGPGASNAEPARGSLRIQATGLDGPHTDPEPPTGGLVTTAPGKFTARPLPPPDAFLILTRRRTRNSPARCPAAAGC